jgi:serine protease Do
MSKKSVLTALGLLTAGVILGVLLVSSADNGIMRGFALSGGDVKLGGPVPVMNQNTAVKALSENFAAVSKAVTPSVVFVDVVTKVKTTDKNAQRDQLHRFFFGPDFQMPEQQPSEGFGSGVIITADGYIATNNHVVENADEEKLEVILHDKEKYKAKIVGRDPSTDLAVIKIEATGLTPAALGNSDNVQVGEWVLAIGNPLGLTSTVTAGIVSAMGRDIGINQDKYRIEGFIQTDAAINPGNSGGALVNMSGEVIGINSAIATTNARYQGYGFAVPVNILKTVAADLIKYGEVKRGYIGVQIQEVTQTMASALGMKEPTGVIVQELVKGGAGEAAGIKAGDVILTVDGKEVTKPNELQAHIAQRHAGDEVTLKIFREGKTMEKKVALRARKEDQDLASASEGKDKDESETASSSGGPMEFGKIGMSVRALDKEERKELGIDKGIVVADVKAYSEAAKGRIVKDDIILEADRKPVNSPSDLKKIVEAHKAGDALLLRVKRDDSVMFLAVQIPK